MDPRAGVRALEEGEISFSSLELKQTLEYPTHSLVIVPTMISWLTSSKINIILRNHYIKFRRAFTKYLSFTFPAAYESFFIVDGLMARFV
jgi:hypothetical protein